MHLCLQTHTFIAETDFLVCLFVCLLVLIQTIFTSHNLIHAKNKIERCDFFNISTDLFFPFMQIKSEAIFFAHFNPQTG